MKAISAKHMPCNTQDEMLTFHRNGLIMRIDMTSSTSAVIKKGREGDANCMGSLPSAYGEQLEWIYVDGNSREIQKIEHEQNKKTHAMELRVLKVKY